MPIQLNEQSYTEAELAVLAKAGLLQIGQKNDPASTTLTAPALHGPFQGNANQYGIYSYPGVRPDRFSALARPNSWLSVVSVNASEFTNEILEIQTGQTAGGSTNATGFCGNPPVPGQLKTCQQTFAWGNYYIKTNLNAAALIGQRRNRADIPANILNQAAVNNPFVPDILQRITDTRSQLAYELFLVGVDMERNTEVVSIQGTAGTDNSRTGWFSEFAGIDGQIKTGYTDAVTGVTCPAMDSVVENFNSTLSGNHSDGSGRNIVATWFDLMYALRDRARQVGMGSVEHVAIMRQSLFRSLVEVIANNYNFYQVSGAQYAERNSTADEVQRLRREMGNGQYLLDDMGQPVRVEFTEGMSAPPVANNTYNSDILVVPVSWNGTPLVRLEYFNMNNQYTQEFMSFVTPDKVQVINNGLFIVGYRDTGLCLEYHIQARMRIILETPFLAGRIDDIRYTYYAKSRQAIPGSSLYQDGGVTYRT